MSRVAMTLRKAVAPVTVALFLALQGADQTLPAAWVALSLGGALAALCGAVDLQSPLSAIERGIGIALIGWVLSVAFGLDPHRSLLLSVPMLAGGVVWVLITRDRHHAFGFLGPAIGLSVAAFVQSALLVLAAARHPDLTPAQWLQDAGAAWLVVPNDITWIACALPLMAIIPRHASVAWLLALAAIFLVLCALMHSRSAAIVAILVVLFFIALGNGSARVPLLARHALIAGVTVVAAALTVFAVASLRSRLQLWEAAWSMFLDHPWTGVGIHNFVLAYRQYLPSHAEIIDSRITPWPHNLILEIAAEWGLIGGVSVLFLAGCLLRRCLTLGRSTLTARHRAALAGLFGMFLLALIEASLLRQWVWFPGTVMCALLATSGREPPAHRRENNERQLRDQAAAGRRLSRASRR
jgi:O-antigen ligase